LNAFADAGTVIRKIDFDMNEIDPETAHLFFSEEDESLHWAVGGGLRIVINENFVIAGDYGVALDNRDGKNGLYIGIGYLF
jgi:hypothetical protein